MSHLVVAESSAEFSPCRRYRYALKRVFGEGGTVMFVGLNPSTADESADDPTIRRCLGFAKRWGYGTLVMANLYAWRATDPRELKDIDNPGGEKRLGSNLDRNLHGLMTLAGDSKMIVCAWGASCGPDPRRAERAVRLLRGIAPGDIYALGLTKSGAPRHPLYVRADAELVPFPPPSEETG